MWMYISLKILERYAVICSYLLVFVSQWWDYSYLSCYSLNVSFFLFFFLVLGIKPRALCIPGKHFTMGHPQPYSLNIFKLPFFLVNTYCFYNYKKQTRDHYLRKNKRLTTVSWVVGDFSMFVLLSNFSFSLFKQFYWDEIHTPYNSPMFKVHNSIFKSIFTNIATIHLDHFITPKRSTC
jgi:hypothetical protein